MVLGLLVLTAIPTVTGVSLATSQQEKVKQQKLDERRMRRFVCTVYCDALSARKDEVHNGLLVLKDDRIWICSRENIAKEGGYLGSFFFIEYPNPEDTKKKKKPILGLVSQVADNPPLLNWIYIDHSTMELKYGNRSTSRNHYYGPWNWTEDETGVTFEGEEWFVAVEDPAKPGQWQIYCDPEDDLLKAYLPKKWKKFQISLERLVLDEEKGDSSGS